MDLMRLACGLAIGYAAHLGVAESGDASWRRLRFVGLAIAAAALLQVIGNDTPAPWRAVVVAGLSLVDLALGALAVGAYAQFSRQGLRARRVLVLAALLVTAVFCGLLGGDTARPLLTRNVAASLLHLLGLGLLAAFLLAALVRQLRGGRHAEQTVSRNRLLERLLLGAIQMGSLRILPELQQRIAETVQEVFGFQRVVLHVYADSAGAFEARAFAGIDAAETRGPGQQSRSRRTSTSPGPARATACPTASWSATPSPVPGTTSWMPPAAPTAPPGPRTPGCWCR